MKEFYIVTVIISNIYYNLNLFQLAFKMHRKVLIKQLFRKGDELLEVLFSISLK